MIRKLAFYVYYCVRSIGLGSVRYFDRAYSYPPLTRSINNEGVIEIEVPH